MIQTYLPGNEHSTAATTLSGWRNARRVVQEFSTKPGFLDALSRSGIQPSDRTSVGYANALSAYAQEYCDTNAHDTSRDQNQLDQIRLLANAPYFVHVQNEISYYENERHHRHLNDEEWSYYKGFKPYMVWYNQLLADYAYTNPESTLSDLNKALIEQSLPSFPGRENIVERDIKQATRGARTEAVSRQLLDKTSIDYSPGTIEDDLVGGDFIVTYNGHRVKIDIKSSLSSIAKVRGGYEKIDNEHISYAISKYKRDHNHKEQYVVVLFPSFDESEIGDSLSLHLSEKDLQKHADFLAKQLHLAFGELRL